MIPLHLLVGALVGWLQGEQHKVIEYLREENRVLKVQLQSQRLRLTDDDRRRVAARGATLGRLMLAQVATIVTPDTMLRWHRQLIARKMDVPEAPPRTAHHAAGDSPPRGADGDRQPKAGAARASRAR